MKKVILLMMMLLVSSIPVFAGKLNIEDLIQELDKMVSEVGKWKQAGQSTQTPPYQPPVQTTQEYVKKESYQTLPQPIQSTTQKKKKIDESNCLIPLLIIGLALLVGDGFAIWYLNRKLYNEFGYEIISPSKLLLFGVQTLPLVIIALKGMFAKPTILDIVFSLGFLGIIMIIQFYIDKVNTNSKYAMALLFVRLITSILVTIVVIILILILILLIWSFFGFGGGKREDNNKLTPDEIKAIKRLAERGRI